MGGKHSNLPEKWGKLSKLTEKVILPKKSGGTKNIPPLPNTTHTFERKKRRQRNIKQKQKQTQQKILLKNTQKNPLKSH